MQYGGNDNPVRSVNTSHMHSQCSLITPEYGESLTYGKGRGKGDFIIFMPYLHWETHRNYTKMTSIIDEVTQEYRQHHRRATDEAFREELSKSAEELWLKHAGQLTELLSDPTERNSRQSKIQKRRGHLGEYLLSVARVYQALDIQHDVRILRDYLHKDLPLHPRRTLDQAFPWKFEHTKKKEENQVVYRETKGGNRNWRTARVVMVDQLWLYILDDHTIISSFPERWGQNTPDWSRVHQKIRNHLDHIRGGEIQSVFDLALVIIDQCSSIFFDKSTPLDKQPDLLNIFSRTLANISGMKCIGLETFWHQLNRLRNNDYHQVDFASHDMIEELRMMSNIFTEQLEVVDQFSLHLQGIDDKESEKTSADRNIPNAQATKLPQHTTSHASHSTAHKPEMASGQSQHDFSTGLATHSNSGDVTLACQASIPARTLTNVKGLSSLIKKRREELQNLEKSASYVSEQLNDLLNLKQQQASIMQARYALLRSDESALQSRTIMLFTVVTIIFLPLSFMSSVFGMNASDFSTPEGGNRMTLSEMFKLLFPISLLVIAISIAIARSLFLRSLVAFITSVLWAIFFEYSGLRRVWLFFERNYGTESLKERRGEFVRKIYRRQEVANMRKEWGRARTLVDKDLAAVERKREMIGKGVIVSGSEYLHGGRQDGLWRRNPPV
ncbi:hypothetical protein BKA64DRAFT_356615 [Cadophora sp. MPI-SDFR-AT-0126]|nr:hypothetical protein BKA64DRAFT_356615 [Leotiomycetes sp. MPI-SDFR-AT-0126]